MVQETATSLSTQEGACTRGGAGLTRGVENSSTGTPERGE